MVVSEYSKQQTLFYGKEGYCMTTITKLLRCEGKPTSNSCVFMVNQYGRHAEESGEWESEEAHASSEKNYM